MAVEKLFTQLKECNIFNENHDSQNIIRSRLKDVALKTYYTFRSRMCPYQKQLLQALSDLKTNQNIVVTKPDKGNATVILNKADYVHKMDQILPDPINFAKVSSDLYKTIIKYEDRNNTLVDDLFKKNAINEAQKRSMKSCGARPGFLFGQPKVHKPGLPMRPILSTCGSFNYNMSKYLVSVLSELCSNEFSVSDSFDFAREISSLENHNYYMASFDIKSLFTNIPVAETCQIILNKLFPQQNSTHYGFDKMQFERMLNNCLQNNIFLFNGNVYEQVDGCPMGGCISPTMANIFLCHYEKIWIDQGPIEYKPILYKRYVDDSFLLFAHKSHVEKLY